MNNLNFLSISIHRNVKLSRHTTFRIGGPADFFICVKSVKSLKKSIEFAGMKNIPFFIIGGGSNLLVCDMGVRGLVIKNAIKGIHRRGNSIIARSGEKLSRVLDFVASQNLSGLEFAAGIPGTIGGAIYGNAGAYGKSIGDKLACAKIMDCNGNIREVEREYFNFQYRRSCLKETKEVVLQAEFSLKPGNHQKIRKKMEEIIAKRRRKHPSEEVGCAGSFFKNIDPPEPGACRIAAGSLLDQAGAKGMSCNQAVVYYGHANFLINPGGATAADIIELARELKKRVKERFGIQLEEEVIYVDEYLKSGGKFEVNYTEYTSI